MQHGLLKKFEDKRSLLRQNRCIFKRFLPVSNSTMQNGWLHNGIMLLLAAVWFANGFYCKLLNGVPRHRQIVARILGHNHAASFTIIIGALEVCMAIWIISAIKPRWCAALQIAVVGVMNIIEALLAPDLLLFGRWNALFAFAFIMVVYYCGFKRTQKPAPPSYT